MRKRFLPYKQKGKEKSMFRDLKIRFAIIILLTIGALFALVPSVSDNIPDRWKNSIHKVKLGLDLQGGMHLMLEVQSEKAVESYLQRTKSDVEAFLKTKGCLH